MHLAVAVALLAVGFLHVSLAVSFAAAVLAVHGVVRVTVVAALAVGFLRFSSADHVVVNVAVAVAIVVVVVLAAGLLHVALVAHAAGDHE